MVQLSTSLPTIHFALTHSSGNCSLVGAAASYKYWPGPLAAPDPVLAGMCGRLVQSIRHPIQLSYTSVGIRCDHHAVQWFTEINISTLKNPFLMLPNNFWVSMFFLFPVEGNKHIFYRCLKKFSLFWRFTEWLPKKKKKPTAWKIFISGRCPEKILLRDIILDITVGNETTSCLLIT